MIDHSARPTLDEDIACFVGEYAKTQSWDIKTAYSELFKLILKYKKILGNKYIPGVRLHIEKNNPELLEWFDGLMLLV